MSRAWLAWNQFPAELLLSYRYWGLRCIYYECYGKSWGKNDVAAHLQSRLEGHQEAPQRRKDRPADRLLTTVSVRQIAVEQRPHHPHLNRYNREIREDECDAVGNVLCLDNARGGLCYKYVTWTQSPRGERKSLFPSIICSLVNVEH